MKVVGLNQTQKLKISENNQDNITADEDGASAIEFALVAPILFLIMMGIIEFGMIMYANNIIENATTIGARYSITGSDYADESRAVDGTVIENGLDRVELIKATIRQRSSGLLDEENISISCQNLGDAFGSLTNNQVGTRPDPTISGAGDNCESAGENGNNNAGAGGEAVIYNVEYNWELFTPLVGRFFGDDNALTLQSALIVKNEQF